MPAPDLPAVRRYLLELQDTICTALEEEDASQRFLESREERPGGGLGRALRSWRAPPSRRSPSP
jgi:coproporphyrinogen III oxidase